MPQIDRILQIFLFHLSRRIVNRMPISVVIVLTIVVIALLVFMPQIREWFGYPVAPA